MHKPTIFSGLDTRWCLDHPRGLLINDLVSCLESGGLLHHRAYGTILFLGEANGVLDCSPINLITGDHVVGANFREYPWWPVRLVRLDPYFVSCHFLVVLLTKHSDDIECRATRQANGDQFDRIGARAPGHIIKQKMVLAPGGRCELAIC